MGFHFDYIPQLVGAFSEGTVTLRKSRLRARRRNNPGAAPPAVAARVYFAGFGPAQPDDLAALVVPHRGRTHRGWQHARNGLPPWQSHFHRGNRASIALNRQGAAMQFCETFGNRQS